MPPVSTCCTRNHLTTKLSDAKITAGYKISKHIGFAEKTLIHGVATHRLVLFSVASELRGDHAEFFHRFHQCNHIDGAYTQHQLCKVPVLLLVSTILPESPKYDC